MTGWGPIGDEEVEAGLLGLQAAALQAIEAFRGLLDVAEELVREPGLLGEAARAAAAAASGAGGDRSSPDRRQPAPAADEPAEPAADTRSNVRRIPLS